MTAFCAVLSSNEFYPGRCRVLASGVEFNFPRYFPRR
jgi:hypothetical protein